MRALRWRARALRGSRTPGFARNVRRLGLASATCSEPRWGELERCARAGMLCACEDVRNAAHTRACATRRKPRAQFARITPSLPGVRAKSAIAKAAKALHKGARIW